MRPSLPPSAAGGGDVVKNNRKVAKVQSRRAKAPNGRRTDFKQDAIFGVADFCLGGCCCSLS